MKRKDFLAEFIAIGALAIVNLLIYRNYWLGNLIFSGKDTFTEYMPVINFQTDCLHEFSWPLWNPYINFGYPYVEHYLNSVLFPTHLLMELFIGSSVIIIQRELLFWIFMGGLGIYLTVRELGNGRPAGVIAAVSYMFCGPAIFLPNWSNLVYNAGCFPFLILGYVRSIRMNRSVSLLSIFVLAAMIWGGYITSSIFAIYLFVGYVAIDSIVSRRISAGVKYLAVTIIFGVLLSLPKLLPLYSAMAGYKRMSAVELKANLSEAITLYDFASYFLPVKYFSSLFIGSASVLAIIYALLRKKVRLDALFVMAFMSGWFLFVDSEGNFSILHRIVNEVLPMMKLVRNDWMYWIYPSTFGILYISRYVDLLLKEADKKVLVISAAIVFAGLVAVFSAFYNSNHYLSAFLVQAILVGLLVSSLLFFRNKEYGQYAVAVLVCVEFLLVFARVDITMRPQREGDLLKVVVIDQHAISRSFEEDNTIRSAFIATAVQDDLRPSISQSRQRPHLISGLGGAPTYNYYPGQYGNFIDYLNLKYFAGWWYNSQERQDFETIKDSPLLAQMDGQPLFVLFDAGTKLPVRNSASFDGISCSSFDFGIDAPSQAYFLLNQMYDSRWKVSVDGIEQPIERANNFFMGLQVPAGRHRIVFLFRDRVFSVCLGLFGLTFLGLVLFGISRWKTGKNNAGFFPPR